MNQIDLSNQYDVLKNLDMTTSRCFVIHSNRLPDDKSVLAFGIPEGDPTYWPDTAVGVRNNAGVMEFRHAGEGWQIMGSGGSGSGHVQNTDEGTTSPSFIIHDSSSLYGDPVAATAVLVMGSSLTGGTFFESAIGVRNNHGVMEYRNNGENWTPMGSGSGGDGHLQNTDTSTTSAEFIIAGPVDPPVESLYLAFGRRAIGDSNRDNNIGFRNFHGTMEYRNDGGTWSPVGAATPPPPPVSTIDFITRAEYIHPFLM